MAAITGCGRFQIVSLARRSAPACSHFPSADKCRRSFRSVPAEKALSPAPVITTTRMSFLLPMPCSVRSIVSASAFDMAFCTCGRLRVRIAVGPFSSTRRMLSSELISPPMRERWLPLRPLFHSDWCIRHRRRRAASRDRSGSVCRLSRSYRRTAPPP